MPTVLIAGASRGIGLALAREFAATAWTVHATHRGPQPTPDLDGVDGVHTHRLEVTDPGQVAALAAEFAETPLDLFVHNAGIADPRFDLTNAEKNLSESRKSEACKQKSGLLGIHNKSFMVVQKFTVPDKL